MPKKISFAGILLSTRLCAQVWLQLPDFPGLERDDGVAVVINNKAYLGSGFQLGFTPASDFYSFDVNSLSWSQIASLPVGAERQYASAFKGSGCFYIVGGLGQNGPLSDMYKYEIATDMWTTAASKPGGGIFGMCCFEFGNKIVFAGGRFPDGSLSNEVWEYTISTDSWSQKKDFPFGGRWRASATELNNTGYLLFGLDDNDRYRKELYSYDPLSDTWAKLTDFPDRGRTYATMQATGNRLTVFAGIDTFTVYHSDVWRFELSSSNWTQGPALAAPGRRGGMSFSVGNKLYYSCGITETQRLKETWLLDLLTGLDEIDSSPHLSVWPNPISDRLYIRLDGFDVPEISVMDMEGKELKRQICLKDETNIFSADLQNLKTGTYTLKIKTKNSTEYKRIIKN